MQRLPSSILLPKWRVTSGRVPEKSLRPMVCRLKQFMPWFSKRSAKWVTKLLGKEKKKEQVRRSKTFAL
jgi:hypothetical protein